MIRLVYLSLALITVPVFFGATDQSISLMHFFGREFYEDGFAVNINVVVPLFGVIVLLISNRLPKLLVAYTGFIVVWLALSLVCGMFEQSDVYNVVFYIQTILPVFAIFAGYALVPTRAQLERVCLIISISTAVFVAFLWFVVFKEFSFGTFLHDRNSVMQYIAIGVPQFRNYFPASTLIAFNFALSKYIFDDTRNPQVHAIALVALFLFFPLCWSRTALLGYSLSLAIQIALALRFGQSRAWNKSLVFSVMAAFVLPLVVAKFGTTVGNRSNDIAESDMRRLELFKEGLHQSAIHPIFGDKFVPKWEVLAGGQEVAIKRLFPAHNQYIDYLLRGGYPFLIAFLAMVVDIFRRGAFGIRLGRAQEDPALVGICAATIASYVAFVIGANFQLYFVQLQSAVPIFFLTGVMFRTVEVARQCRQTPESIKSHTKNARQLNGHHARQPVGRRYRPRRRMTTGRR